MQGVCSADNVIIFITQTHVNAIFEDANKVVQLSSQSLSGGPVVDMGITTNVSSIAVLLKGNTAYRFRLSGATWSTTTLPSTPAYLTRETVKNIIRENGKIDNLDLQIEEKKEVENPK